MSDKDRERGDKGRFTETVSPEDVFEAFPDREPMTAKEVAKRLDVSRRTALNKLSELVERGDLRRKEVGARAVVFWKPPSGTGGFDTTQKSDLDH